MFSGFFRRAKAPLPSGYQTGIPEPSIDFVAAVAENQKIVFLTFLILGIFF